MKTMINISETAHCCLWLAAWLALGGANSALAARPLVETKRAPFLLAQNAAGSTKPAAAADAKSDSTSPTVTERCWLGVSIEEITEPMTSQLGLSNGVGLVVNYVIKASPAAEAGIKRNDILVDFDGQLLVHPAQLRKLVRLHAPGDQIKLTFFQGGKRLEKQLTLTAAPSSSSASVRLGSMAGSLVELGEEMEVPSVDETIDNAFATVYGAPHPVAPIAPFPPAASRVFVQREVNRSLDGARKSIADALRQLTNSTDELDSEARSLQELLGAGVQLDDKATVIVRTTGNKSRSIVLNDDDGSIVCQGSPKLHLVARDKSGNIIFDGDIDSATDRAKLPKDIREKIEPLLENKNQPAVPALPTLPAPPATIVK